MKSAIRWLSVVAGCTVLVMPAWGQAKACEELRAEIEAKIQKNGVAAFTLTVVDRDAPEDGKVVGTCDGGRKKILYKREG